MPYRSLDSHNLNLQNCLPSRTESSLLDNQNPKRGSKGMWSLSCIADPLDQGRLVQAACDVNSLVPSSLVPDNENDEEFHVFRTALADCLVRQIPTDKISTLDMGVLGGRQKRLHQQQQQRIRKRMQLHSPGSYVSPNTVPYILERSDVWCSKTHVRLLVRVQEESDETAKAILEEALNGWTCDSLSDRLSHIASCLLQHRIRQQLKSEKLVAFISNGSILPRKSGVSHAPMASPPAVPFEAPKDSRLSRTIAIDMGPWKPYCVFAKSHVEIDVNVDDTLVSMAGMAIPEGITLIVGGGYHGKSTMLRTVAAGVYNKIPGDGREFCVTVADAVTVRAEDGRYVNNCNVSAFISNLPVPPGITNSLDTKKFSTREASGSTSQAANVSEAIEMGASAILVDEDISAANFMARDGRMRSLVMDESITPLLYRVNGMYDTHRISSIVVVGGVGDWLDVPHQVILMDKYVASDATAKAQSISRQFSYGHVQYAGRGVVHRLPWDKEGTPVPRRPNASCVLSLGSNLSVSILEGSDMLSIERELTDEDIEGGEDDFGLIDMSRCEQILGKKAQLYGLGLCIQWIIEHSQKDANLGVADLLRALQEHLNKYGIASMHNDSLVQTVGFAYQPRKYEVFMALTRMRGLLLEEMPIEVDDSEAEAAREEARKKKELADLWNARRKNNRFASES